MAVQRQLHQQSDEQAPDPVYAEYSFTAFMATGYVHKWYVVQVSDTTMMPKDMLPVKKYFHKIGCKFSGPRAAIGYNSGLPW